MKKLKFVFVIIAASLLSACAAPNIKLNPKYWQNKSAVTAVAVTKMPKASLYKTGSQGLIDIAISDVVTQQFVNHLKQYKLTDLAKLHNDFVTKLRARGIKVLDINKPIDYSDLNFTDENPDQYAKKNFKPYQKHWKAERLLLIKFNLVGAVRDYYSFIPLDAPKAYCNIEAELIDLHTNRLLWNHNTSVTIPVKGHWHQPPNYPNFNKALNTAILKAKNETLASFFNS